MYLTRRIASGATAFVVFAVLGGVSAANARAASPVPAPQAAAPATAAKQVVGTIKAIGGRTITLTSDAGTTVTASVVDNAKIVRVEPGQTDLKSAVPLAFMELQVGDRILVRGTLSDDGARLVASGVIAMKHADIASKQQQTLEDWQKRGIGGLVGAVDPAAGTINVSVVGATGTKTVAIHVNKDTILRRYAPGSVQFDDAQVGTLSQIKPGDQLRARGARNADGSEVTADEIVTGAFRNISGTVDSVDAANNTLTVTDLVTKKPVVVKVTSQSQIRKLPPQIAQGMAQRLKGPAADAGAGGGNAPAASGAAAGGGRQGGAPGPGIGGAGGRGGGAQADFQQIVSRQPPAMLSDFMKSDAVMIVSTVSENSTGVTAITLVGGVEPILAASPNGQGTVLSPWNIGGGGDAGEAAP